ncbi:MAG TPA: hypothetical protein PKG93_00895 [Bacilli bacterium]|nr:hypothetical protein [Bacilli bacterium]
MKSYKRFIGDLQIKSFCKKYDIKNYTINSDGSIDVNDDVYLSCKKLTELPLRFRNVTGHFWVYTNQLTSLQGCPTSVSKDFYCSENKLTSLKGSPQSVGDCFYCSDNKLTSLEGCPKIVGSHFYCDYNQLTSLVGCPEIINGILNCRFNKITDFKGISEFFEDRFICDGNPIHEIYKLFNTSKCIKWINEYDVIQGNKVIMDRLEEVFHQLGMDIPKNIEFKNYEII